MFRVLNFGLMVHIIGSFFMVAFFLLFLDKKLLDIYVIESFFLQIQFGILLALMPGFFWSLFIFCLFACCSFLLMYFESNLNWPSFIVVFTDLYDGSINDRKFSLIYITQLIFLGVPWFISNLYDVEASLPVSFINFLSSSILVFMTTTIIFMIILNYLPEPRAAYAIDFGDKFIFKLIAFLFIIYACLFERVSLFSSQGYYVLGFLAILIGYIVLMFKDGAELGIVNLVVNAVTLVILSLVWILQLFFNCLHRRLEEFKS